MHAEPRPFARRFVLGTLLLFTVGGALTLLVGLFTDVPRVLMVGAAVLILSAVLSLIVTAAYTRPARAPELPEAPTREIAFEYPTDKTAPGSVDRAAPVARAAPATGRASSRGAVAALGPQALAWARAPQDDQLVEFKLADEPQAPTRLGVPPAFQVETSLEAQPAPRGQREIKAGTAMERRQQIVSGLPLLSSILAEETPAATQIAATPAGKTRGQCSACGTMLWAPMARPIRLRCPKCGNVRTLTE